MSHISRQRWHASFGIGPARMLPECYDEGFRGGGMAENPQPVRRRTASKAQTGAERKPVGSNREQLGARASRNRGILEEAYLTRSALTTNPGCGHHPLRAMH